MRRRSWILAAAITVAAAVAGFLVWRSRQVAPIERLVRRLPREDRVLASFDLAALRRAGFLAPASRPPEQEYRQFVEGTGFDWQRDLDTVTLAYGRQEAHVFARGRFSMERFRGYATTRGGACGGGVCRVAGTTPGVTIGFAQIDAATLAVASSTDKDAILALLAEPKGQPPLPPAMHPVWFLLPKSVTKEQLLPPAAAMFATAAVECEPVYLGVGPAKTAFAARLDATCPSTAQARQAVRELQAATTMLQRMVAREQPAGAESSLAGILTRGEFQAEENRLLGTWPVTQAFVQSLLGASE